MAEYQQKCYSINKNLIEWLENYSKKTNRKKSKVLELALIRYKAFVESQEELENDN